MGNEDLNFFLKQAFYCPKLEVRAKDMLEKSFHKLLNKLKTSKKKKNKTKKNNKDNKGYNLAFRTDTFMSNISRKVSSKY